MNPEEKEHAQLAHNDMVEYINRQLREGMNLNSLLAGIGSATADLITTRAGSAAVAPWFAGMAKMVGDLTREAG